MGCPIPMIVAKQSFLNQTASLSPTTIYTPTEDGDFRVNVYANIDATTITSDAEIHVVWDDGVRANERYWCDANSSNPESSATNVIHAVAGQPIQVRALYGFSGTANPYNLYVTVVQE